VSGFLQHFIPFGRIKKKYYFRIIDEYTLFYLTWIESYVQERQDRNSYWAQKSKMGAWYSWAGYVFEEICYKHSAQIAKALGIEQVGYKIGSWQYIAKKREKDSGTQVDLLFDRDDGVISLCEIKYSEKSYVIDKNYAEDLIYKVDAFEEKIQSKKQIFLVLITTEGVKKIFGMMN
jgi:uncharacterized protein